MNPKSPEDAVTPTAAEALSLTLHATPAAARDLASAQTPRGRRTMLGILLVCALPVIASYVTYFYIRPAGRTNYATLVDPQRPLPGPALVPAEDLQGREAPLTRLKGQWLIVAVGPAGCDADCERRLFAQRQLREMAGAERDRIDKVWLVDSAGPVAPALLAALEASPAMHVLRVDRAALSRWLQPAEGHALEDHLYIVDPLGNWMMRAPADLDPMKLKADLERLLRGSQWWDRPDELPGRLLPSTAPAPAASRESGA